MLQIQREIAISWHISFLFCVHDLPCAAQWIQSTVVCVRDPVLLSTTRCRLRLCLAGTHRTHGAKRQREERGINVSLVFVSQ